MPDVLVVPRGGHILAEVPPRGAYLPEFVADEWVRNGLVARVPTQPVAATAPVARKPRRQTR